jgi:hypothetical protein
MPTKAIVFSKSEFEFLVSDIADAFVKDRGKELRSGKLTELDVMEYFANAFRKLLSSEGVKEMVVFTGRGSEAELFWDGYSFVEYVLEYVESIGMEGLLDYVRGWMEIEIGDED